MTLFEIGVLFGLAMICIVVAVGSSMIVEASEKVSEKLTGIENQLTNLDDLIGRIPGVEDYREPDGVEWSQAMKKNPNANTRNRRNWVR